MKYEALRKWISHVHAQGRGDALFHEAAAEAEELLALHEVSAGPEQLKLFQDEDFDLHRVDL